MTMNEQFANFTKDFMKISYIYVAWILIHYVASHLYAYVCAPFSLIGFFYAPFLVAAPHCQALRWCIHQGGDQIMLMWTTLGTWLVIKAAIK